MRYDWLDAYLLQKKGVTKDLQADWNWIRYQIGGKMFAALCLEIPSDKPYYITLKLEPAQGEALRAQYEDIVPGYYMNKMHWNSIKPDGHTLIISTGLLSSQPSFFWQPVSTSLSFFLTLTHFT